MNRKLKIGLLIAGVVLGLGWGAYRVAAHTHHRPEFRRHIADLCVRAALGENPDAVRPPSDAYHSHRYSRIRNEVVSECAAAGSRLRAHR